MPQVPNSYTPDQSPACETSAGKPVLDIVGVGGSGIVALGAMATASLCTFRLFGDSPPTAEEQACERNARMVAVMGVVGAIAYLASATTGFSRRGRCKEAKAAHWEWRKAGGIPLPKPLFVRPPGLAGPEPAECTAWKNKLAAAISISDKMKLIKQRPASCR